MSAFFVLMSTTGIALLSVLVPLCIAGLAVLGFFLHKRSYKHTSANFRKRFDEAHTLLTADCKTMVDRLSVLAKANQEFAAHYQERSQQYKDIFQKKDKAVEHSLNSLDDLIAAKDYKGIKEVEPDIEKSLNEFVRATHSFNTDLTSILDDDNEVHTASVTAKKKYRRIKNFYASHERELVALSSPFTIILSNAEAAFKKFDECADSAKFSEAKKTVSDLEQVLDGVLAVMEDLPSLEASLNTVIPEKQSIMNQHYQEMIAEDYIVSHLNVPALNQRIEDVRNEVTEKLGLMDVYGVRQELDGLLTSIMDMESCFEEEKTAKRLFESSQGSILDNSFNTEKRYSELINLLPQYQSTFVLNVKYVEQMKSLRTDIEAIGYLKRELDTYLDTQNRQPYTVIVKKISDLQNEMKKTERTMNDYEAYIASLKEDSSRVYQGLRGQYVRLLKSQNCLLEMNVPSYVKKMTPEFTNAYQKIAEITSMVMTMPIDVVQATKAYQPFKEESDRLMDSVAYAITKADEAETCLTYANAYRGEFSDSHNDLDNAEKAFAEADFSVASNYALSVIKTFNPAYVAQRK